MTQETSVEPAIDAVQQIDVREKYHEARSDDRSFRAMQLARQIAEAVCDALEDRIRDVTAAKYKKRRELHERIAFLEGNAEAVRLPKSVLAALRTLQAYGNYASHYEPGQHRPPVWAANSAMGSLELVVNWFLFADVDPDDPSGEADLPLRDPPPAAPGFFDGRRILAATRSDRPELSFSVLDVSRSDATYIDPTAHPEAQLGALLVYYATLARVCESICRAVLSRETTREVGSMDLEQLSLLFSQLGALRPAQLPAPALACVEEVLRRRAGVLTAIRDRKGDFAAFSLEARQQEPTEVLRTWFERDYLGIKLRRGWYVRVTLGVLLAAAVLWATYFLGSLDGGIDRGVRLRAQFCDVPTPTDPKLCEALSPKGIPSAGASR